MGVLTTSAAVGFVPSSGGLVSSLYRQMLPSAAAPSPKEADRRLDRILSRLCAVHGPEVVMRRVADATQYDDSIRARIMLRLMGR